MIQANANTLLAGKLPEIKASRNEEVLRDVLYIQEVLRSV